MSLRPVAMEMIELNVKLWYKFLSLGMILGVDCFPDVYSKENLCEYVHILTLEHTRLLKARQKLCPKYYGLPCIK